MDAGGAFSYKLVATGQIGPGKNLLACCLPIASRRIAVLVHGAKDLQVSIRQDSRREGWRLWIVTSEYLRQLDCIFERHDRAPTLQSPSY